MVDWICRAEVIFKKCFFVLVVRCIIVLYPCRFGDLFLFGGCLFGDRIDIDGIHVFFPFDFHIIFLLFFKILLFLLFGRLLYLFLMIVIHWFNIACEFSLITFDDLNEMERKHLGCHVRTHQLTFGTIKKNHRFNKHWNKSKMYTQTKCAYRTHMPILYSSELKRTEK